MKLGLFLLTLVPSMAAAAPDSTAPKVPQVNPNAVNVPTIAPSVDPNVVAPIDLRGKVQVPLVCVNGGLKKKGSDQVIGEKVIGEKSGEVIGEKVIGEKVIGEKVIGEKSNQEVIGEKSANPKNC